MFLRVGVESSYTLLLAQRNGLCLCRPESEVGNQVRGEKTTGKAKMYLIWFPRTLEIKGGGVLIHLIHTPVKYK